MSTVTNIILTIGVENMPFNGRSQFIAPINDYLTGLGYQRGLKSVEEYAISDEIMEVYVYAGAFNDFNANNFMFFLNSLEWIDLDCVVGVIVPQEGPHYVWRPPGANRPERNQSPHGPEHEAAILRDAQAPDPVQPVARKVRLNP